MDDSTYIVNSLIYENYHNQQELLSHFWLLTKLLINFYRRKFFFHVDSNFLPSPRLFSCVGLRLWLAPTNSEWCFFVTDRNWHNEKFLLSLFSPRQTTIDKRSNFLVKRLCSDSLESVAEMFRAFSHNASVQINIFLAIKRLLVRQISQRRQQQLFFSFHITTHESFMGIA